MGTQHSLPLGHAPAAPAPVLGDCGHCGTPATVRTLSADVVACAACWAATLRGELVRRCPNCAGGRRRAGCHECRGRGVVYVPREVNDV